MTPWQQATIPTTLFWSTLLQAPLSLVPPHPLAVTLILGSEVTPRRHTHIQLLWTDTTV